MIVGLNDENFQFELIIDGRREVRNLEFVEGDTDPCNWDNPDFAVNEILFEEQDGRTYAVNKHANGRKRLNRSF